MNAVKMKEERARALCGGELHAVRVRFSENIYVLFSPFASKPDAAAATVGAVCHRFQSLLCHDRVLGVERERASALVLDLLLRLLQED